MKRLAHHNRTPFEAKVFLQKTLASKSSSSSYGLIVRFQLLSRFEFFEEKLNSRFKLPKKLEPRIETTPPHDDAVTFSYEVYG